MPHPDPHCTEPGGALLLAVDDAPPRAWIALCWEVFFASRGRGVSMRAHFPWLHVPGQACFVTLRSDRDVLAGCAIRFIVDATGQRRAGAIGLVCVDPRHRGRGHATRVLERAIAHARALGLADLVLWTRQPGVYERHGFKPDDDALLGKVSTPAGMALGALRINQREWPGPGDHRGLPPFASHGVCWRSPAASALVLHDAGGAILADWVGADDDVAGLLAHALPSSWRINAIAGDTLLRVLADRGYRLQLEPSRLRMIRPMDGQADPTEASRVYKLRVLDRI